MAIAGIPQNLSVQQGNGQVYLDWSASVGAVTYQVYRSTDSVSYASVGTPVQPEFLDTTVIVGTNYYYKVASVNASGTSTFTPPQSVVPSASGTLSLAALRSMAQDKADKKNSNFVSKAEWNQYINQSAFELYDLLITAYQDYAIADPYQFTTTTSDTYPLPLGFYKLLGVDCGLNVSQNSWVTLSRFDFASRNRFAYPGQAGVFGGQQMIEYRVMGSNLKLMPKPAAGMPIRVWFIPRMTQLLKDTDILDGVSGWTEYVIVDAAIKALEKEESDSSTLVQKKMDLRNRIESSAINRDAGMPDAISDVRGAKNGWGFERGGW